jgi:hypothetical protein
VLKAIAAIGIGPGKHPSQTQPPVVLRAMNAAYRVGPQVVTARNLPGVIASQRAHNGWYVLPDYVGNFGVHYSVRAFTALEGLGANSPAEAVYPSLVRNLDSSKAYVVHFAPGTYPPPVNSFWSLTMYDQDGFLAANPIDRYSIGSLKGGIEPNPDGSVDLYLQNTSPGSDKESNWLPTPNPDQSAGFVVTLRFYWPQQAILDNTWPYPSIQQLDQPAGP